MNRFLALAVVALMAVGATGCATGVEDPQPPPPTPTPANPPSVSTFSANEELDTGKPDPFSTGDNGLDAPKPDLEKPPVPIEGTDEIDPYLESDTPAFDPSQLRAPIPVNE